MISIFSFKIKSQYFNMSAITSSNIINSGEGFSWFIDRLPDYNLYNFNNLNNINILNSPRSVAINPTYFIIDNGYTINNTIINNIINPTEDFIPIGLSTERRHPITVTVTEIDITEEQQDCCICMDKKEKMDICCLQCPHSFCGECVKNTLKSYDEAKCPMCREKITSISVQMEENRVKISEYCLI